MATDLNKFLTELNEILGDLRTHADKDTAWSTADKGKLFKRLDYLKDKSKDNSETAADRRDNIDIDNDLKNLDALIGADKTAWATEKSKLEKEKKDVEKERDDAKKEKQDEINNHQKTKLEVADKINSDLITGLTTLVNTGLKKPKKDKDGNDVKDANGNIVYEDIFDKTQIDNIKKVVDEIKSKGVSADFSSLDSKFKEVKEVAGKDGGNNYWAIGGFIAGVISVLLLGYMAFLKPNSGQVIEKDE